MPKNPKDGLLQPKRERPIEDGHYVFKANELIHIEKIKEYLNKFINKFMDDEAQMLHTSKPRVVKSNIELVTADTFEKIGLKENSANHIILEVFKDHCPACNYNAPIFRAFSKKLDKHGYKHDIKLLRTNINN